MVPQSDIRCAAGREVYFKGQEKKLLSVVDSIFASGYLTEGGQSIQGTLRTITDAGFTYEIESA
jgi:biotin synthase